MEINFNKPLVPCVRLMGLVQRVEYEGLHVICFQCGQYGNRNESCTRVKLINLDADSVVS